MSRCYWLSIFAIVGLALWSQSPRAEGVASPSPAPKEHSGIAAKNGGPNPNGIPVIIVETPKQAIAGEAAQKESREHEAKDLEVQLKAADAGERAATATERQIIPIWIGAFLSFLGTGLIFWSLCLTRKANQNTINAINQEQANAERQLRAYVFVDTVSLKDSNSKKFATQVIVTTKNFGQTPAKQVMVDFNLVVPLWGEQKRKDNGTKTERGIILAPGADIHTYYGINEAYWQLVRGAIESAKLSAFVVGKIEYVDAFGILHCTWFKQELQCVLGKIGDGDNFATTEDGNDYT